MKSSSDQITPLLEQIRLGDKSAQAILATLVYPELRRIAAQYMRRERPNHTLQPTALVNEAFLKLACGAEITPGNRALFFAIAANVMRQILVDHARRRAAARRGGGAQLVELEDWQTRFETKPELVLEIDRLLSRLASVDARQAAVVEMRYFPGLTEDDIAESLGISERTVKRDWTMARAWMRKELAIR